MDNNEMLFQTVEKAMNHIRGCYSNSDFENYSVLFPDITELVKAINLGLYRSSILKNSKLLSLLENPSPEIMPALLDEYRSWKFLIQDTIELRNSLSNYIDREFTSLMDYIQYAPREIIRQNAIDSLLATGEYLDSYQFYYQKYKHLWGTLDINADNYEVIDNRVDSLINNHSRFISLYTRLADYRSKLVLLKMLSSWLYFDARLIMEMKEGNFPDYYDLDLLKCDNNEVMIDVGAFNGDSAESFIDSYGHYKEIICYEITPETVVDLQKRLSPYPNIDIRNKGLSDEKGVMYIGDESGVAADGSANQLSSSGTRAIDVVTLDDDISFPVTLIKMDIEGAEQSALKGCINHIKNDRPKLLICVYHNNTDIVDIPDLIDSMRDDYTFYLRSNGDQWGPSEIVLFAL